MTRLIAGLLLIIGMNAYACDDHFFFRVGAGKQGNWLTVKGDGQWMGEKSVAADISLGYRHPVKSWLWWDITAQHKSHWDRGWPLNDKDESELDSVILGIEFRY